MSKLSATLSSALPKSSSSTPTAPTTQASSPAQVSTSQASTSQAATTPASTTKAKSSTTKHKTSSTSSSTAISHVATTSKGLGTTTTAIVAVVATVVGLVLFFLIFRFIMHRRNRRSANPLPPVMPISRHREQNVFQFEESKFNSYSGSPSHSNRGTWYSGQHLVTPSPMPSGSDTSLVQKEMDPFLGSAPPSPGLHRASDQSLGFRPRTSYDDSLPRPAPAFRNGSPGSSRSSTPISGTPATSAHSDSAGTYFAPSQSTLSNPHPLAESTSARDRNSPPRSRSPAAVPRSRSPNQGGHPIRPRPNSMVSTTSRASRATNNIRGAPHGPHSNVQIILPAPLAPQLSPYARGASVERWGSQTSASDSRRSVVDQWAGLAAQRDEPPKLQKDDRRKKSTKKTNMGPAIDDARLSIASSANTSSSSSSTHPNNPFSSANAAPLPQRSSQVFNSSPLSTSRERTPASPPSAFRSHSPPPVPAVPTAYNRFADVERGRKMSDTEASPAPESNIEQRRSASRDRPVFFAPSPSSRNNSRTRA